MTEDQDPATNPRPPAMEIPDAGEEAAATVWDWGSLLDFAIDEDDSLILPWETPEDRQLPAPPPLPEADPVPPPPPPQEPGDAGLLSRVRKRDPRLVCENYLAGRVPCACPEMDEMDEKELEEEEEAVEALAGGKKRARTGGAAPGAIVRCQVPGCEADIRELKGYHRRHRVCLRCANASSVVLEGEHKRYCQQCGKFHILSDFDEGKRSCRRKLERHNKRRRRRPTDRRNIVENVKEHHGDLSADITCDGEPRKEVSNETDVSNKIMDHETLLESEDGDGSPPICSLPDFQIAQSNSIVSFAASGGDHIDERMDNAKSAHSSTICDNKSVYSSVCPTGRISFKLYDWNPAEFPRRLRHQIFQWLSNMPVELEGYIRPGCTILTVFIAMPQFMWEKLYQDVALYIRDLVNTPESLFLGRSNFLIYLSNMIVQVLKDGTSLMNVEIEVKAPRLHYVYPAYFEAGKPMEFVACGTNLDQPKFRFLVSFAGKYLVYDSCDAVPHEKTRSYHGNGGDSFNNSEHEVFRICISWTDSELFGPAFIEVENESGLSNFVPVLFGNKHICSELQNIQEVFKGSLSAKSIISQIAVSGSTPGLCKYFVSKQATMSELLLDVAWLLKEPRLDKNEDVWSSTHILRLTSLLKFSMQNKFVSILEVVWRYLDNMSGGAGFDKSVNMNSDANLGLLLKYTSQAKEILEWRASHDVRSEQNSRDSIHKLLMPHSYVKSEVICTVPWIYQDVEIRSRDSLVETKTSSSQVDEENIPLVTTQIIHRQKCYPHLGVRWSREDWSDIFPRKATRTRLAVFLMVSVVMCFGACIALLHPHKVREFAVSVRRGLFGGPLT